MSDRLYAMAGKLSGELLTYKGAVICHTSKEELQWLVPGARVVELPDQTGMVLMSVRNHPDFASVEWPLKKEHFR